MKIPWSISTTVRNPERLRGFLSVLKKLEDEKFDKNCQMKYQVLLIKEKLYEPKNIPVKYRQYYDNPEKSMPYEVAEKIFHSQDYRDPPMRGRQSVNPLNKLGFAIAREKLGDIKITELGNKFLSGDYDISFIFFKSLLKFQFPNPWSKNFSEKKGFNIMPFIATMHFLHRLNKQSTKKGLDKKEFSVFIPTLINANQIDEHIEKILELRKTRDKDKFIYNFVKEFYEIAPFPDKKINSLFDYGDNTKRYFWLTRYFRVKTDPLGYYWRIDLEPSRMEEIKQLLSLYNGETIKDFHNIPDYINYISDITQPELPWEKIENLRKIAFSIRSIVINLSEKEDIRFAQETTDSLKVDITELTREDLENYISNLRAINLNIKEKVKKKKITGNKKEIEKIIKLIKNKKELRRFKPEQFEKLITEALKVINDEILIKPNYPIDDDGEPIFHAPGKKSDIECFYQKFYTTCEVTLNISRLQWVQEGQPVMRHLRDFEIKYYKEKSSEIYCIFIAPKIHDDTYSTFWNSVKYEYDGKPQKIIPMTTDQFVLILETLLECINQDKILSHNELYSLCKHIVKKTKTLSGFSEWAVAIPKYINDWKSRIISS